MNATELANHTLPPDHELMIVERPVMEPGQCIVSLMETDRLGFIDTGIHIQGIDPRSYVSVTWVLTTAAKLGMVPEGVVADLAAENEDLREQLERALKTVNAVESIENEGFRRIRKSGKPASVAPVG